MSKKNSVNHTKRCQAYKQAGKRLTNKKIKLARHQKRHPNDLTVPGTVPNYETVKICNKSVKIT